MRWVWSVFAPRIAMTALTVSILAAGPACLVSVSTIPEPVATPLAMEAGDYGEAVWVNDTTIAFTYTIYYGVWFQRTTIGLFDTVSGAWRSLDDALNAESFPNGCRKVDRYSLAAYSETELGFRDLCMKDTDRVGSGGTDFFPAIKRIDIETGAVTVVQPLVWQTHPGPFAWAPDGQQIVLEFSGTHGEIGIYTPDANRLRTAFGPGMVNLSPDHREAALPDWSEGGIAFFAAGRGGKLPRGHTAGLSPFDLVNEKWELLHFNPGTREVTVLMDDVVDPNGTLWSPDSTGIAFSGEVDGKDGIWIFSLGDRSARRVWNQRAAFDWSPDGTQIVVVESPFDVENGGWLPVTPQVIDVAP